AQSPLDTASRGGVAEFNLVAPVAVVAGQPHQGQIRDFTVELEEKDAHQLPSFPPRSCSTTLRVPICTPTATSWPTNQCSVSCRASLFSAMCLHSTTATSGLKPHSQAMWELQPQTAQGLASGTSCVLASCRRAMASSYCSAVNRMAQSSWAFAYSSS